MSNAIEGGCQCGAVRYLVNLKRVVAYACHCSECKKQSASAFAISVPIPTKHFALTGKTKIYKRPTDSGTSTHCHFCETCGTRLYHQSERSPELVTIKGGTLDNVINVPLVAHLWTKRKQTWLTLPADVEVYETQPQDLKQWRTKLIDQLQEI